MASEQRYVDMLFARLDASVATARERLSAAVRVLDTNSPLAEDLVEREVNVARLAKQLDALGLAESGLVFGRIDVDDDGELDRRYIGRMGMDAPEDHYRTLVLDWRAPAARPYYLATTAHPEGVHTRRHIRMRGRTVTSVHDEALTAATEVSDSEIGVASEAALVAALERARTGHMPDIVETIQREQDLIIRAPSRGVVVVEGGPGTGKTAVALHRVAYLLYTWRQQLEKTGVLLIGPNATFLEYISRVLPQLGETGVVMATPGTLYPGLHPTGTDSLLARELKGSAEMVTILTEAVRAYETVPEAPIRVLVDSVPLVITAPMVSKARARARRSRRPHNRAVTVFRDSLIDQLTEALVTAIGTDPLGGPNLLNRADAATLRKELLDEPAITEIIDTLWPQLTPEQVLSELFSSQSRIDVAARDYDDETRTGLFNPDYASALPIATPQLPPGSPGTAQIPWTPADAALLDELAHILGMPTPDELSAQAESALQQHIAEAEEFLDIVRSSENTDVDDGFEAEILAATDVIDATALAHRQIAEDVRTTAERAAADYTWAYGHVVIDEAQELTPMEWRMVFRHSPNRWMTIVGDVAQTSSPAGVDSWEETLAPFVDTRLHHHELTINYRTPSEIMEYANALLPQIAPEQTPARAIRSTGVPVQVVSSLAEVPHHDVGITEVIDASNVADCKGLEFDHVVLVHPGEIIAASPQGLHDLYVAATRATKTLTIVDDGEG